MKKLLFILFSIVSVFPAFAQNYLSTNNYMGNWEDPSTWTKTASWLSDIPDTLGGSNSSADIYGYVTRNGNLTTANGSILNVYDTLWVKGDLTVNQQLNVMSGGLLIVEGNFTVSNGGRFKNEGISVIQGSYLVSSGGRLANNANFYSYNGGSSSNGGNANAGTTPLGNISNLQSDFPALFEQLSNGVLPVKLISFEGAAYDSQVKLSWVTAWEENFDYFIVERAGTDRQFKAIGKVQGNGNTQAEVAYNFTDDQPLQGQALYRLKAVDYDNTYEYHDIISVYSDGMSAQALKVYPNPSADRHFQVDLNSEINTISLLNTNGQLVYQTTVNNYSVNIDLPSSVKSGAYLLVVTDEQGNAMKEKVMVL